MGQRRRKPVVIRMEEEKLTLRAYIHRISHLRRLGDRLFQHISRVHLIRRSVRAVHVADQSRHLALLRSPREDLKGAQIRIQIHIRILFS